MDPKDVKVVTFFARPTHDEYECPFCLNTFFYDKVRPVHVHGCMGVLTGKKEVYMLNGYAFRHVDQYNVKEASTAKGTL